MRIDSFRRSVFLSIGLVVTGTLLTSDLMASPASAFVRHPAYVGIHREAIAGPSTAARARAARQRASRSATRQRIIAAPTPTPKMVTAAATRGGDEMLWQRLRNCEAGGRYDRNSGNGYFGAYQMSAGTWHGLGYSGLPHQASPEVQDEAARKLQARSGWGQWPACSRRVGAR
jgi:Transglycosylase-like domain